jgi:hypothetical protein
MKPLKSNGVYWGVPAKFQRNRRDDLYKEKQKYLVYKGELI